MRIMLINTVAEEKVFYLKYPVKEFVAVSIILLIQPVLLFILPNSILVKIWVILAIIFFGYCLIKQILINFLKHSYIMFNGEGITIVGLFNMSKKYLWKDFKGYILIEKMVIVQFNRKTVKISGENIVDGCLEDIIKIIEENKTDVKHIGDIPLRQEIENILEKQTGQDAVIAIGNL